MYYFKCICCTLTVFLLLFSCPGNPCACNCGTNVLPSGEKVIDDNVQREFPRNPYSSAKTMVFISTGMPDHVLRDIIEEAADRKDVYLVLRGWEPPKPDTLVRKLYKVSKAMFRANIMIDPAMYRAYDIDAVPVFISKNPENDKWYRVTGESSIEGAEKLVQEGKGGHNQPAVGPLHDIAEPDILEAMKERAEKYNWQASIDQVTETLSETDNGLLPALDIPAARHSHEYSIDPSVVVSRDITLPDGRIVAKKGTVANPLDYVPFPKFYAIYNPSDKRQHKIMRRWLSLHPNMTVMATNNNREATEKLDRPVFPLSEMVRKRFQINEVP
ncbi:MAG: TrbC family F-type conjugative pilus assembly protein, partial [Pseudomonadota bacterium]|nr:TrbC family F-type conjugative pilus assembly protein [Pseudomonadota bacterium]